MSGHIREIFKAKGIEDNERLISIEEVIEMIKLTIKE